MARKDEILQSFLAHPLIQEKYELNHESLPQSVKDALNSDQPIVKTLAIVIEQLEVASPVTDGTLRSILNQYLNTAAI